MGDVACVSFWWLREPGWSKSSSAREVEGGVVFVGVDQLWLVVGWVLWQSSGDHCASGLGVQRRWPRMGKKSVVSFTFALSFFVSFLLFGELVW